MPSLVAPSSRFAVEHSLTYTHAVELHTHTHTHTHTHARSRHRPPPYAYTLPLNLLSIACLICITEFVSADKNIQAKSTCQIFICIIWPTWTQFIFCTVIYKNILRIKHFVSNISIYHVNANSCKLWSYIRHGSSTVWNVTLVQDYNVM